MLCVLVCVLFSYLFYFTYFICVVGFGPWLSFSRLVFCFFLGGEGVGNVVKMWVDLLLLLLLLLLFLWIVCFLSFFCGGIYFFIYFFSLRFFVSSVYVIAVFTCVGFFSCYSSFVGVTLLFNLSLANVLFPSICLSISSLICHLTIYLFIHLSIPLYSRFVVLRHLSANEKQ